MQLSTLISRSAAVTLVAAAALIASGTASSASAPAADTAHAGTAPPKHRPANHRPRVYAAPKHNPRAEEEDELGASVIADTFSTDYMLYRGGPTQTSPRIYVVFWGDWSATTDSLNVQGQLYWFLKGVGGSSFNATQADYAQGCTINTFSCPASASFIQNTPNQLKNFWYDNSAVPAKPTQTDVAREALRAASRFGDYGVNTQYFIALPKGHDDASFPTNGGRTCGYHSWTLAANTTIQYTSLSYMPDAGTDCGNYSVNNSVLDGVTIVASHEYAETETDPWVGAGAGYEAWDDSHGNAGETGDKCAGGASYNKNLAFSTGTFPIQSEWSNYNRYFNGSGCLFWR
jgi:hypothetical protein